MVRITSTTTTTTNNKSSSAAAAAAAAVSAVVEIVYQKPREFANIHEYDDNIVDIDLFPTAEGYRSMDTMIDDPADSRYEVLPKEVVEEEDSRNDEHNNSTNQSSYSSKIYDMKDIRETTATNSTVQSSESHQSESDVKEKSPNDKTTVLSSVVVKSTGDTLLSSTESQLSNAIAEDTTKKLQDEMKKKNDDKNSINYSIIPSISTTCSNNITEKDLQNEDDDSKRSDCNKSVDYGDDNDYNGTAILYESTPDDDRTCASLSSNRSFISSSDLLPSTSKLDNAAPEEAVKEGINVGKHVDILVSWLMTGFIGCADAGLNEPAEFLDWDGVAAKNYNTIINNNSIQQQPKNKDNVQDEYQESKEENTTETTYGTNNDDLSEIKKDCSIDSGISTTSTHDELSVLVRGIHYSNNKVKESSPSIMNVKVADKEASIYPLTVEV